MKKSTRKSPASFTSLTLSLALIFTLLWNLSFQSFASSEASGTTSEDSETISSETEDDTAEIEDIEFTLSASVTNLSTDEKITASDQKPTIISISPESGEKFSVNFHCDLSSATEQDLEYRLSVMQVNSTFYINYSNADDYRTSFGFLFTSNNSDVSVEVTLDEDSDILLDDQKMTSDFWDDLISQSGYTGTIASGSNAIDLKFTFKVTRSDKQELIAPLEEETSAENISESLTDVPEDDTQDTSSEIQHELIDLTDDDIILEFNFYQASDKMERAEIEDGQTETIIKLSSSANFNLSTMYYALPEFCNPVDCKTYVETKDNGFTIYFETAIGETRSHSYIFQPSSDAVEEITLSYDIPSSSWVKLNADNTYGGLSAEECLFGRRGISDQVCYKAAKIVFQISAKVDQPTTSTTSSTSLATTSSTSNITSSEITDQTKSVATDKTSSKKEGILIPYWFLKGLFTIIIIAAIIVGIYLAGEKRIVQNKIIPKVLSIFGLEYYSNKSKDNPKSKDDEQ